ncbi:MAG: Com family DNA-binding transcriptional regulator [Clostridiales bacterium]|nr:Com family DNA-binding transcriptional regulator [Clostridiales bacterium]
MKAYACCPQCGYKLCKGESGSDVDILCPRCGKLVRVIITADEVRATPTEPQKKIKEIS